MFAGFDWSMLTDFALLVLIPGIVETAKKFGLAGNGALVLSLALGFAFVALAETVTQGLMPEAVLPWLRVALMGIGGALAASGYYDLAKKFFGKT